MTIMPQTLAVLVPLAALLARATLLAGLPRLLARLLAAALLLARLARLRVVLLLLILVRVLILLVHSKLLGVSPPTTVNVCRNQFVPA